MKQKELLIILIPIVLVIFAWIVFNIYHNAVSSTIPETTTIQIQPIKPNFNMQIIDQLKQRVVSSPVFELEQVKETPATPSVTLIPEDLSPTTSVIITPQVTGGQEL